jgi:hypothetical protein
MPNATRDQAGLRESPSSAPGHPDSSPQLHWPAAAFIRPCSSCDQHPGVAPRFDIDAAAAFDDWMIAFKSLTLPDGRTQEWTLPGGASASIASRLGISVFDQAKIAEIPYSEVRRRATRVWRSGSNPGRGFAAAPSVKADAATISRSGSQCDDCARSHSR